MQENVEQQIFTSRDGVKLVADIGGRDNDTAIVLLHGGGQTRHSWTKAFNHLINSGHHVINFDARGHGDSDWSSSAAYSLADRANDLATIAAKLKTPFVLVGASLGGATSIQAIYEGLRPAALVLVDIVPEPEFKGINRIISFMREHQNGFASLEEAADAVAAYSTDRPCPRDPSGLQKNLRKRSDGRLYWHWDPLITKEKPSVHHEQIQRATQALVDLDDMPVLLVRGLSSDVVSDASVAAFQARLPRLQVIDVAGAGHMVAGDKNDVFNEAIQKFIAQVLENT